MNKLSIVLAKLEAEFPELLVSKVRDTFAGWKEGEDVELGFGQDEPSSASVDISPSGTGFVSLFTKRKQWLELCTVDHNGVHMCVNYLVKGSPVFRDKVVAIMRELTVIRYKLLPDVELRSFIDRI